MTLRRIAASILVATAAGLTALAAARAETTRTVYLSATDSKGPVTDLEAADLVVTEGGKERVVSSLKPATATMDVTILVDDNGSGIYQAGVRQFMEALLGHARFAITGLSPQAIKIVDYTTDVGRLGGALEQIGRRGRIQADGEQLLEAIDNASRELQERNAARPVIFVLTISGDAGRNPDIVMRQLQRSGAMLNAVFVNGAGLVLGDGPRQSGGRIERITAALSIAPAITKITDHLLNQFVLTYTLPDGVKPSSQLSVSTRRRGVSLLAPRWLPEK